MRPTARQRPFVRPVPWLSGSDDGRIEVTDPYVRRYWAAVLGAGAVADLLRLAAAARTGRAVRRPVHLHVLVASGLVQAVDANRPLVRLSVPPVPGFLLSRLPPPLVREHAAAAC